MNREEAEGMLTEWAAIDSQRDDLVRAARQAGVSKNRIHALTGIARTTIDRILETPMAQITLQEVTEYLDGFTANWPRYHRTHAVYYRQQPALVHTYTPQQIADALFADAEFQALKLGTWLTTPEGEVVAAAVESLTPPPYRQDIELLVEALKLAAKMQQDEARQAIARRVIGALAVGAIVAGIAKA